jgi:major membrane immunogen (membrane-anchored lipoprotein)
MTKIHMMQKEAMRYSCELKIKITFDRTKLNNCKHNFESKDDRCKHNDIEDLHHHLQEHQQTSRHQYLIHKKY